MRRTLFIGLAALAVLVAAMLLVPVQAQGSDAAPITGSCGDDLTWTLDGSVLTISGTGDMYDLSFTLDDEHPNGIRPWGQSITKVIVEDGVTSISPLAFARCALLKSVELPDSITFIGYHAFESTSLDSVNIPDSVEFIGSQAFGFIDSIVEVSVPATVIELGNSVFEGCTHLERIDVDESSSTYCSIDGVLFDKDATVLMIYPSGKPDAFYSVPDSVTTLDMLALSGSKFQAVSIGPNVASIDPYSFDVCLSLVYIDVDSRNPYFVSVDGVLFDKDMRTLVKYPSGSLREDYSVPEGVIEIARNSMSHTEHLQRVVIPDSVKVVGESAFYYSGISDVEFGSVVEEIDNFAFSVCYRLSSLELPDSLVSISRQAFASCWSLQKISFGSHLSEVSEDAFLGTALYEADCTTSAGISADSLNGSSFAMKDGKLVRGAVRTFVVSFTGDLSASSDGISIASGDGVPEGAVLDLVVEDREGYWAEIIPATDDGRYTVDSDVSFLVQYYPGDKPDVWPVVYEYGSSTEEHVVPAGSLLYPPSDAEVDGYALTWYVNGDEVDLSTYTVERAVTAVAHYDLLPSAEVVAGIRSDDSGVHLLLIAVDGGYVPSGTVTVSYLYVSDTVFHGQIRKVSAIGMFEQGYVSSGEPYAYLDLDFAGLAEEQYTAVFGASAVFSYASAEAGTTIVQVHLPDTIPSVPVEHIADAETASGLQRTISYSDTSDITVGVSTADDGGIVIDASLSKQVASRYSLFSWYLRGESDVYLVQNTGVEPSMTWDVGDAIGDFKLGVVCLSPATGAYASDYSVDLSISGAVFKTYQWVHDGRSYSLDVSYDSSEFKAYFGKNGVSPTERNMYSDMADFIVVDDVVASIENGLSERYTSAYGSDPAGQGYAEFILSFVQGSFWYQNDDQLYGQLEYFAFPMETIQNNGGDCEDLSILCAALFKAAGYDTGLFSVPTHCIAAVALDEYTPCPANPVYADEVSLFSYMTDDGKTYYGCETTLYGSDCGIGWISNMFSIDSDGQIGYSEDGSETSIYSDAELGITYRDLGFGLLRAER